MEITLHRSLDQLTTKRIGIIQSRGLGDLIIALPIALHYREQGYTVVWPICREFMTTMTSAAPWVEWIALDTDSQGLFFYDAAIAALSNVTEVICLYQFLSNRPDLTDPDLFPILKFDQTKYARAGVAFKHKQRLPECIRRDPAVEKALYDRVVRQEQYIVTHLTGSDVTLNLDFSEAVAAGYQVINIEEGITDNAFDWLGVLEGAASLYLIDSCFSNMVDGMDIGRDKWFIRRSKMDLTPVLLSDWQYFPLASMQQ